MTRATNVLTRVTLTTRVAAAGLVLGSLALTAGASASATTSHATKEVVISTVKTAKFGTILVSGHTVYTLTPNAVKCATTCLKYWNEVLLPQGVTHATAGPGVNAASLGTVKGVGGKLQVTYAGKALYFFFLDKAPGEVKGNLKDTWGKWSVVVTAKAAGVTTTIKTTTTTTKTTTTTIAKAPVTTTTTPTTTTTTSSGGGGVGF
jgi:predicted lipoprotein with Yx(FWY)xxD motif